MGEFQYTPLSYLGEISVAARRVFNLIIWSRIHGRWSCWVAWNSFSLRPWPHHRTPGCLRYIRLAPGNKVWIILLCTPGINPPLLHKDSPLFDWCMVPPLLDWYMVPPLLNWYMVPPLFDWYMVPPSTDTHPITWLCKASFILTSFRRVSGNDSARDSTILWSPWDIFREHLFS